MLQLCKQTDYGRIKKNIFGQKAETLVFKKIMDKRISIKINLPTFFKNNTVLCFQLHKKFSMYSKSTNCILQSSRGNEI